MENKDILIENNDLYIDEPGISLKDVEVSEDYIKSNKTFMEERNKRQDKLIEALSKIEALKAFLDKTEDIYKKRSLAQLFANQMSVLSDLSSEQIYFYGKTPEEILEDVGKLFYALDDLGITVFALETGRDTVPYDDFKKAFLPRCSAKEFTDIEQFTKNISETAAEYTKIKNTTNKDFILFILAPFIHRNTSELYVFADSMLLKNLSRA